MRILIYLLLILFIAGTAALYGGVGWCIAWVLDKGLDVNVNYSIFIWVGVGIFFLKAIPFFIFKTYASKVEKEFKKDWDFK
jgi:multidrug transporter EmrE-like cation transporter